MNVHLKVVGDPLMRVAELEAQARNIQVAFDGVAQGVCLFDRDGRLTAANRSFVALHRLAPNALRPGATLRDVAMALEAAGTCPMPVDDYVAYCRAIQERNEPRVWCVTLADGRVLRVRQDANAGRRLGRAPRRRQRGARNPPSERGVRDAAGPDRSGSRSSLGQGLRQPLRLRQSGAGDGLRSRRRRGSGRLDRF